MHRSHLAREFACGRRSFLFAAVSLGATGLVVACDRGASGKVSASAPNELAPLLPPSDLSARLADVKTGKIAVLHVGPQVLWKRARVPGSLWIGAADDDDGAALAVAVKAIAPAVEVVAYCGCCAVESCPNVGPARRVLAARAKASVLDLPTNFAIDWAGKGFAVERG